MNSYISLDHDEVKKILPHRDPMLLVDEVQKLDPGKHIEATFHIDENMEIFKGHFPDNPVFPGVYQVESATQATTLMVMSQEKYKNMTPLFLGINKVSFKKMIRPGETIRIVGDLVNEREEKAIVICKAQIYTESGLAMEEETATAIR